ncbi:bifunctional phosphoglucose/phosphomannose isomerase [Patescibacteria group bacterium]|nr:bifunctional phosphoglucose/phosphomannose isomerase [Patescibacteria group bacterium]
MAQTKNSLPKNHDPEDMLGAILAWPKRLRTGFNQKLSLDPKYGKAKNIVVCGMGGSAIGASLAGELFSDAIPVPFTVVRDYTVPAYVDKDSLVIAVSHSGGTEETISCYACARERGANIIVITTGGELADMATRDTVPVVKYSCPGQPRAALPLVLGLWINVLHTLGYISDQKASVEQAASELDTIVQTVKSTEDNLAAELSEALVGKIPIIYGAGFLGEAARRTKGQVSENANQTAAWEVIPEQNHNALVGYEFPEHLKDYVVFVLLRSSFEHPRHAARFEFIRELLGRRGLLSVQIEGTGPDRLAHLVTVVFWADLTTYDLAARNEVDPTPVEIIGELKACLAEKS